MKDLQFGHTAIGWRSCPHAFSLRLLVFICGLIISLTNHQAQADDACKDLVTDKQRDAAMQMIRLFGYDCQSIDQMCPYVFSHGFTVWCNHLYYKYELENHGGQWSVKAD